jgi:hypothetical protein
LGDAFSLHDVSDEGARKTQRGLGARVHASRRRACPSKKKTRPVSSADDKPVVSFATA